MQVLGEKKNAGIFPFAKREGKKRVWGTCHIWDDNIKMNVKRIILLGLDSILLDLVRENRRAFVKMAMNSWIL
jgi:hypothetical protein